VKILVIVHQFLPRESAGTEVYTWKLAKALQARGHDLAVYYTQSYADRPQYQLRRGTFDGLKTFEVVNNHEFRSLRDTWKDERMEEHLKTVLDEYPPDVVHIQHLHLHSVDYVGILKERGLPVVYTLAEYLNICPRNGWMVKLDFSLCEGPEMSECAKCARNIWPEPATEHIPPPPPELLRAPEPEPAPREPERDHQPHVEPYRRYSFTRFVGKVKRRIAGISTPHPASGEAYRAAVEEPAPRAPEAAAPAPKPEAKPAVPPRHEWPSSYDVYLPGIERRWREHKEQLALVDLFVAPSKFLRDRFVESGMIDPGQVVVSDYGFDHGPFEGGEGHDDERERSENLVVGFIGSIAEQKGVHLLIDAFNELPEQGVECRIHGGLGQFAGYVSELRARRRHLGVRFLGRYDNTKIAEVLRGLDVLVIPSRWYENSPLTIHEAFMAGVPVITGDRGGMAELVEHEKNGLHFKVGDAHDLKLQIERLMREPELLARMRENIPRVKTIAEDAEETEERFRALMARVANAS